MLIKRGLSQSRCNNKGQVTVFIILGIVILASVMFLLFIISQTRLNQLETGQEQIISDSFKGESLRLYVEDCLMDSLEDGLTLIGQQGRLWDGQPGSTLTFVEGENGLSFTLGEFSQVYYGITYNEQDPENSYPCEENITNLPDFCRYVTGDDGKFGTKQKLTKSNVENDLEDYMINESVFCVQELLYGENSLVTNVLTEDIELDVSFEPDGIMIKVEYPINIYTEGKNYFHMEDFSFIYLSEISDFLTRAVTTPLNSDQGDVTYVIDEDTLQESHIYEELSPILVREETGEGDNVFIFTLGSGIILQNDEYLFQYAVQNRPPALDYISRDSCGGYDYLAINGYETEYGFINITPNALDPDDDNVSYRYDYSNLLSGYNVFINPYDHFYMDLSNYNLNPGLYNFTVYADDEHGLMDWQVVRVLLDRNMEVNISIATPYETFTSGQAILSIEDPVFINITAPESSVDEETFEMLILDYEGNNDENFSLTIPYFEPGEQCLSLPNVAGEGGLSCDLEEYSDGVAVGSNIEGWDTNFLQTLDLPYFQQLTDTGVMEITFTANYCSQYQQERDDSIKVKVQECIDWPGVPLHPYPYVPGKTYHNYVYVDSSTDELKLDSVNHEPVEEEINPFLARHECCASDGTYEPTSTICYQSEPGCYNKLGNGYFYSDYETGYVLEEHYINCSGDRGNICDGDSNYQLAGGELRCGHYGENQCDKVSPKCEDDLAWGYRDSNDDGQNDYWCHGKMGCEMACTSAVVYVGDYYTTPGHDEEINKWAIETFATSDSESDLVPGKFNFRCGCYDSDVDVGDYCDSNMDGLFSGYCNQNGECSES
ncbi:hypothetical protein HN385_02260 [archaeon]|jgi:hypothetical protein|nr:hypothetical protein [archaeon]MBT3450378.1 hypothetical protein [archaeon]MBT6868847.1 hypothetical protein [archaeon]MBT7192932.1 hypothetical protein [archaeon]MBT7380898.1 hypothetical protein [archaeon]